MRQRKIESFPSPEDAAYCLELRKKSKRGERLTDSEYDFVVEMWESYRQWFKDTEGVVFEETAPWR